MYAPMNQHEIPEPNECCKNCAYSEQYAKVVHREGKSESKPVQRRLFSDRMHQTVKNATYLT